MGQPAGVAVTLHELVHGEGEPRWTAVVDALLGLAVVVWVVVLSVLHPAATLRLGVPLVLAVVVVGRVLALVELSQRRREPRATEAPTTTTDDTAEIPHAA